MEPIRCQGIEREAVLWDLDGTLVDTEYHWTAVQTELVGSFGGTSTESQALSIMGRSQTDSIKVLQRAGVRLSFEEIARQVTEGVRDSISESVHWRPGAAELPAGLRARGWPCVLVTMSPRHIVGDILNDFPANSFELAVTRDMVSKGKPHPEAHQIAFRHLERTGRGSPAGPPPRWERLGQGTPRIRLPPPGSAS
ncbi:HAD family phosphatase [Pseudarthrobacter sp. B907]|uniref:HAD family hydrolase n=1 Tax=Pseudarthrobacter sp. B907 TaxID=3158261 RepID=UPI0032DAAD35